MDVYEDISRRYEAELRTIIPVLYEWWESVAARELADTTRQQRWPMGPCSHPRFIEIFRRYYLEILDANDRNEGAVPLEPEPEPDEEMWGKDTEARDGDLGPVNPSELLLSEMILKDSELKRFLGMFVFIPVGNDE